MIEAARRWGILGLALSASGVPATECHGQPPERSSAVVRQIDHILISSSQPVELFSLLVETFGLPVAWPMKNHGGFVSGGVALGNVNLEVLRSSQSAADAPGARFVGLALEPAPLRTSQVELDARGIPHGAPAPYKPWRLIGPRETLWTTMALPSVSSAAAEVFFCEYGHDVSERRRRLRAQLESRGGGPMSVASVREVVYGTADLLRWEAQWQKLLDPLQPTSAGAWQIGDGPALRLIAADRDQIQELVIAVKSLEQARRFLKERGLLRMNDRPHVLTLAGPLLEGLTITLVDARSADSR